MQTEALAAARQYEKDAIDRIRRIAIASAELEVKGKHKGRGDRLGQGDVDLRGSAWDGDGADFSDYRASSFVASQY